MPSLLIPISGSGVIADSNIGVDLPALAVSPFGFTDVFIYAHGWWTDADSAMTDYAHFAVGMEKTLLSGVYPNAPKSSLQIGIHWPATISEDDTLAENILQPLSFFSRGAMADDVGEHGVYAIMRLILEARADANLPQPRFHLIGHSFGCKIVSNALNFLAKDTSLMGVCGGLTVNLVLLQAAFDQNNFDMAQDYAYVVAGFPKLRMLVTKSQLDRALGTLYPDAHRFANLFSDPEPAMGFEGPTDALMGRRMVGKVSLDVGTALSAHAMGGNLLVADLTSLHAHDGFKASLFSGSHADIYRQEIYALISAFLFG